MGAFGLDVGGGGDIAPFIKYNAKAGRFYRIDREQGPNGWQNHEVDISNDFEMLFCFDTLEAGHAHFGEYGPEYRLFPYPYAKGNEPKERGQYEDDDGRLFKPAFRLSVILRNGEEREFASNAGVTVNAVAKLYDVYARERPNDKAFPVVALDGTPRPDRGNYGNFTPVFQIDGWVDPEELEQWLDAGAAFVPMAPREGRPQRAERRRGQDDGGFRTDHGSYPQARRGIGSYDERNPPPHDDDPRDQLDRQPREETSQQRYERRRDEALSRPTSRPPQSGSSRRGPPGSGGSMARRGLV